MMKFTSADEVLNALDRVGRVSNLVDGPSHSAQQILNKCIDAHHSQPRP